MLDMRLTLPQAANAKGGLKINREKIINFQFDNVKMRVLDNEGDLDIRRILERKLESDRKKWKKEVGKYKKLT